MILYLQQSFIIWQFYLLVQEHCYSQRCRGNTTTIKTTAGITATNITDATNSNTTADTAIGEIETSLGHVAGHINSLGAYQNTANALASIELESAAKLMDTNFALETAKLMKNSNPKICYFNGGKSQ